jgi:hypothetical protein
MMTADAQDAELNTELESDLELAGMAHAGDDEFASFAAPRDDDDDADTDDDEEEFDIEDDDDLDADDDDEVEDDEEEELQNGHSGEHPTDDDPDKTDPGGTPLS